MPKPNIRRKKFVLSVLALLALPLVSAARQVPSNAITVDIVTDDGRTLRQFDVTRVGESETGRAYVEATRGERYAIRVRNHTRERIGLVIAVDGRNVISGAKSHLRRTEPMYILRPYESASYDGWRTSDTRVHRFYFTESRGSYAGAFGDHSAMGVIAVAAFAERTPPGRRNYLQDGRGDRAGEPAPETASPSSSAGVADEARSRPGTGFGEGHHSEVVRVRFEPQPHPFAKRFYKYEWRETLVRLGFIHPRAPHNRFWPDPDRASAAGYSPYPPGYGDHR